MEFQALCPSRSSMKKTFFYNFFPTKMEEDLTAGTMTGRRAVVEIRDIYPPPTTVGITKTLSPYEIGYGTLFVSCNDMLDHVVRYWSLEMANQLNLGSRIGVVLMDVTDEKNPKKYDSNEVIVQMVANGNGDNEEFVVVSCMGLFRDRKLKVNDVMHLFWDSEGSCFRVKLGF